MVRLRRYGFEPDSMSIAKAMSSAYLPISARAAVAGNVGDHRTGIRARSAPSAHGFTYGGHPVSCRRGRCEPSRSTSAATRSAMCAMSRRCFKSGWRRWRDHPLVGEAVGVGLIGAIELVADKKTRQNFEGTRQGRGDRCAALRRRRACSCAPALGPRRALSAARHHRSGDRRILRPLRTGAEKIARLGDQGKLVAA